MKHTFKCGIVGESNSGDGDAILRGMQESEWADTRKIEDAIRKPILDELKRTQQALYWLIETAGGEVRVPSNLIAEAPPKPVGDWLVHHDIATGDIVLRTRPHNPKPPTSPKGDTPGESGGHLWRTKTKH